MPIYEYVCDDCGYDFERMQSFSSEPIKSCPRCAGALRRVISPVGVIFRGSGWYITDSKRQLSGSRARSGRQLADGAEPNKNGGASPAENAGDGAGAPNGNEAAAAPKTEAKKPARGSNSKSAAAG